MNDNFELSIKISSDISDAIDGFKTLRGAATNTINAMSSGFTKLGMKMKEVGKEIEKVGKPAIFIPFPYAAENHQEYNARTLEKAGAATVILDNELTADKLHVTIETIVKEEGKLTKMGEESQNLSINNVEENIYKEIISAIKI